MRRKLINKEILDSEIPPHLKFTYDREKYLIHENREFKIFLQKKYKFYY
jgi:hypothetical protein